MVDGTGRPPVSDILLLVENGRFAEAGPSGCEPAGAPEISGGPAECLDFSGATLLPGLVDAHVHLCWSGVSDPEIRKNQVEPDEAWADAAISGHIRDHLACGVFAVRDGGDRLGHAGRFSRNQKGPLEIRAAGRAWHRQGRYGSLIGRPVPQGLSLGRAIFGDPDPGDHVKVVQSGLNSLKVFGKPTKPQFSLDELTDAVGAAKSCGLSVMAHANGPEAVEIAVRAGCASVEHGFFMGRENLELLADSGCVWVPTSVTMTGYSESLAPESPEAAVARRMLDSQLEQMALARSLGVKMAVGTDSGCQGVFHGLAVRCEMENMVMAGFTIEEAVKAGTSSGAKLLGFSETGEIARGRDATFLVIPGPPCEFIENLKNPTAFYIKGRKVFG
ncbi:MAG: amidohydrolase family protein [Deltaproteobacteria bacterium]|nr:amidohydrolase family protein [Deltaproteobacteria bacterium]